MATMTRRHILCSLLLVFLGVFSLGCAGNNKTISSVQLSPSTANLAAGTTVQFTATAFYQQGQQSGGVKNVTSQVTWTSSTPSVATVDASGVATAVSQGSTVITATLQASWGPATANAELDVTGGTGGGTRTLTSIKIIPLPSTQTVYASGETAQFLAVGTFNASPTSQDLTDTVAWQSADIDVATINASGLATAVNCNIPPCITNITATTPATDGSVIVGTSNLTLTASTGEFVPSLTVYPVGQGAGTIVSSPVGINCGAGASCTADFVQGSTVTITASATSGLVLGFSSNCIPTAPIDPLGTKIASCTVNMGGNETVGVIFNK
jgi:hypothetical protein